MKKIIFILILFISFFGWNLYAYEEQPVHMRTTAPYQGLLKSSFSIERKTIQNHYYPHASGFYIRYKNLPYAVTARHVVQTKNNAENTKGAWGDFIRPLFIRMHTDDENVPVKSRHKEISLLNNKEYDGLYFFHKDSSIDAAIFPAFFKTTISEISLQLEYKMIQKDELVLIGEDVNIFGFPGPYGFAQGRSVVRSGTICFKLNRHIYLLDANTWPGDSGGMVVSKPYFGVPKEKLRTYQWQIGGKLIGLYIGRKNPQDLKGFNLPESLEAFRIIVSGQALIDMVDSAEFKKYHKKWKEIWTKIKEKRNKSKP